MERLPKYWASLTLTAYTRLFLANQFTPSPSQTQAQDSRSLHHPSTKTACAHPSHHLVSLPSPQRPSLSASDFLLRNAVKFPSHRNFDTADNRAQHEKLEIEKMQNGMLRHKLPFLFEQYRLGEEKSSRGYRGCRSQDYEVSSERTVDGEIPRLESCLRSKKL